MNEVLIKSRAGQGNIRRWQVAFLVTYFWTAICYGQTLTKPLEMLNGGSMAIDCPNEIARLAISNPEVVDAVVLNGRELLLQAKGQGTATVILWTKSGERIYYKASVNADLEPLRRLLKETFPKEAIQVHAGRDAIALTGKVSSQKVAEMAAALAASVAKSVVNNLEVPAPEATKQILLRVRFAEVDYSKASALGVNLLSTGAANTPARVTTGQFSAPAPEKIFNGQDLSGITGTVPGHAGGTTSNFSLSDALNIFAFRPDLNLGAFIKALQTEGVLQILAEPNLVTSDGKEASFLVGGEFPVPIVQGGANVGAVTVQFREFGIRLTFLPEVTSLQTIKLHVKPEVSALDFANGVSMSGFNIPALTTRKMETHIELSQGQSFVIAGLIDDRVTENLSKVPGLAAIPVLGTLFKSRQETKSKTDLIVLVSPEIVHPTEGVVTTGPVMPRRFLPVPSPSGEGAKTGHKKRRD